ncbi:hypothetical protein ESA94_20325 [Lacibacter luteus]|uniref:Uncharacterized protein n=1 Tax=Lacibacter luteus TaxID=2508719 RepID=A0A4Q1CDV4_9BACT|nr:hypothetical protein [Lacibacter luteus]RXK57547.1 hypothetical protein ESA94_20325 [Lacibacter luteus]
MKLYTTVKLPSGILVTIYEPNGPVFFMVMTESKGDLGLFMKSLIKNIVRFEGQQYSYEQIEQLSFSDLNYLVQVINPLIEASMDDK